jgi:hypothetical protein
MDAYRGPVPWIIPNIVIAPGCQCTSVRNLELVLMNVLKAKHLLWLVVMFIVFTYQLYPFLAKSNRFIRPKTTTRGAHKVRKANERENKKGERVSHTDPFQNNVAHRDTEKPKGSTDWR